MPDVVALVVVGVLAEVLAVLGCHLDALGRCLIDRLMRRPFSSGLFVAVGLDVWALLQMIRPGG